VNDIQSSADWGLLANGASGSWSIDIDESLDGDRLHMQIDGPRICLGFAIQDLRVLAKLQNYLSDGLAARLSNEDKDTDVGVILGRLDALSVSVIHDNELPARWFIIVDGHADAIVRFAIDTTDAEAIVDALKQAADDLSERIDPIANLAG
jgi:hypothetical protein